jgi:hypothetical protein
LGENRRVTLFHLPQECGERNILVIVKKTLTRSNTPKCRNTGETTVVKEKWKNIYLMQEFLTEKEKVMK